MILKYLQKIIFFNCRNNCKLAAVIKSFAHRAQLTRVDPGLSEVTKFSELDNILLGLDAAQYIPLFNQHGLNLETFLELNEQDLEKIGVDKVNFICGFFLFNMFLL